MNNEQTNDTAANAQQGAPVAPEKASSKKGASHKKGTPKAKKAAKGGKTKGPSKGVAKTAKATRPKPVTKPRAESKGAKILELIGRPKGASLAEIMKVTAWQAHSVRGFLSTAAKKHGLQIESAKNEAGERTYRIAK